MRAVLRRKAHFTAVAVLRQARIYATILAVTGHSDNTHRLTAKILANLYHIQAGVLVGTHHGAHNPVGPVDVVAVHRQGERVSDTVP